MSTDMVDRVTTALQNGARLAEGGYPLARPRASSKPRAPTSTVLPVPVAGSRARLPAERVGALRRELTGKQRGRVFGYDRHLEVLNEGTTSPLRR